MIRKFFFGFSKPKIRFEGWEGGVETLPLPERVTLPLSQGRQMPFKPVVEVGERVKTGQFIAQLPDRTGVHATVTGIVESIGPGYNREGEEILTLSIHRDSDDEMVPSRPIERLEEAGREELIGVLAELGFASPWKPEELKGRSEGPSIDTVVVLAVDEEPPISVQRRFLTEFGEDLADSIKGIRRMAGEEARIVVAVPEEMKDRAEALLEGVEVLPVGNSPAQTNRALLVSRVVGERVGYVCAPGSNGVVVFSAEDIAFAGRCLRMGKPRTNKLVTVWGPGLQRPKTVKVRLGTPVGHVLSCLGVQVGSGDRVIFGGPLMGYAQPDLDAPITRETDGVTVIPSNEVVPFSDAPCINCGRCVEVCPVFIPVNLVGRYAEFGFFEKAVSMGSGACVECGLCAYVCPSRRPLVQYMRFANKEYIQRQEESAQQEGE